MKTTPLFPVLLLALMLTLPVAARADQQPEMIIEKMAVKLTRGVTNAVTSIAELPKQSILTVREMGGPGYVIGPLKGIGMTLYRGFIGMTEAVFFLVPQPGYYDPMIDPPYVWQGWEPKRETTPLLEEEKK
ncbi:MAG: exosortase system-associated protein, TIGR04073 family [Deltaproteobacteria bacterium]|nr:exosortase system-associated protein, TIGR04073 family [Deltaproteobacteria bacterium]